MLLRKIAKKMMEPYLNAKRPTRHVIENQSNERQESQWLGPRIARRLVLERGCELGWVNARPETDPESEREKTKKAISYQD